MNTPNIRFKGYTDAWEQRKLGEVLQFQNGFNGGREAYGEGTAFISVMDILNNQFITYDCIRGKATVTDNELERFSVRYGDVLFQRSSENVEDAGTSNVYVDNERTAIFGGFVIRGRQVAPYSPRFMKYLLDTKAVRNQITKKAQGAQHVNVSQETLQDVQITLPSQREQEAVESCLCNLDTLIALHQRKCDDLQEVKKYMLQKLFPQNGAKIPEIRFAGFTGEWEQRKLGDVFQEYSEKRHEELPPLTIIQGGGTILREESDRNLQYDKSSLSNYKMVKKDDFIVHLRSFEGGLEKANSDGIISPAYHTLHGENTDSRFYYPFFRSREFIEVLLKPHVYGIRDGKSIDIEGMKTINIPVPSLEEQQRIGEYIEQMDNLISLQQNRCDNLKEVKKFMLQNMFPRREASPMGED